MKRTCEPDLFSILLFSSVESLDDVVGGFALYFSSMCLKQKARSLSIIQPDSGSRISTACIQKGLPDVAFTGVCFCG